MRLSWAIIIALLAAPCGALCHCCVPVRPAPPPRAAPPRRDAHTRRELLARGVALGVSSCACCMAPPQPAYALAKLVEPDRAAKEKFDVSRNAIFDSGFARGMAEGMGDYEAAVAPKKKELFGALLASLPRNEGVVVEIGMGSFPNAPFFAQPPAGSKPPPAAMDIIGIDPNDSMARYAQRNAKAAGLLDAGHSLRILHGVAEALPLESGTADAVVCTLTLCSVVDPPVALAEMRRVLRPGGKLLFVEHVLSETDAALAQQQRTLTPMQAAPARAAPPGQPHPPHRFSRGSGGAQSHHLHPSRRWRAPTAATSTGVRSST